MISVYCLPSPYCSPLAKKLKDCGVFGVSSDEYLNYALENRREWEKKGKAIVEANHEKILSAMESSNRNCDEEDTNNYDDDCEDGPVQTVARTTYNPDDVEETEYKPVPTGDFMDFYSPEKHKQQRHYEGKFHDPTMTTHHLARSIEKKYGKSAVGSLVLPFSERKNR